MSEPISATSATSAVATASILTLVPGAEPAVMIGAFTGAVLFIITNDTSGNLQRLGLFVVSFLGGVLCANWAANALSAMLPDSLQVNMGMAALISSACVVRMLQYLMKLTNNPESWLNALRGLRGK
ncbi:phage holin family protein [Shewanella xiamenensis]|uniref:phage holin family protein n=1 Tax=Shewanella xiamenensis TaxID=332186 RepID=UPI0021BEC8AD|nr:phage holin family protein [Shewanella xiamenensis]MCT8866918.1 phage holin family protein [Shewanella xiamenensis]